jgi:hypothetical protein
MDWRIPYTIGKLLEFRCLKWARMAHLDIWNTSYGTYSWKALDEGYNFALDLISIGSLHAKLWASKVIGVPIVGISGLSLGSPGTKWHLGAGLVDKHKVYYKGKGDGFPQVRTVVSLVSSNLPVACPSTKSAPTMH